MLLPASDAWHRVVIGALACLESRPLSVNVATHEDGSGYFILVRDDGAEVFLVLPDVFADADEFAGRKHHALSRAVAWLLAAENGSRAVLGLPQ